MSKRRDPWNGRTPTEEEVRLAIREIKVRARRRAVLAKAAELARQRQGAAS